MNDVNIVPLEDIGNSADILEVVSEAEKNGTTLALILDRPRTMEVKSTRQSNEQLVVSCRDAVDNVTVVLYLPYGEGSRASAGIISPNHEGD